MKATSRIRVAFCYVLLYGMLVQTLIVQRTIVIVLLKATRQPDFIRLPC